MSQPDPYTPQPGMPQPEPPQGFGLPPQAAPGFPAADFPTAGFPTADFPTAPAPAQPYTPEPPYAPAQPYAPAPPAPAPDQLYGGAPAPAQPYAPQPSYAPAATPPNQGQPYPPDPGQPYAPAPGQPYNPGQPYGAGYPTPGGPTPPPQKKSIWLFVLIGVLVVALAGFAVYWFVIRDDGSGPIVPGQAKTPEAAVRGYLEALQAGDATAALQFSAAQPLDNTFVTNEALAASLAIAPITEIQVTPDPTGSPQWSDVGATYQIGSQRVSASYQVAQHDKYYLIDSATNEVNLSYVYVAGTGMKLNGISLDGILLSSIDLFPGAYQLTVDNSMLAVSRGQFTVNSPDDYTSLFDAEVALAPDATSKFATAAQNTLDACMQEKEILTSCGFGATGGLPGGVEPQTDTIKWSFTSGDSNFSSTAFRYSPSYSGPTEVDASISIRVRCDVTGSDGNSYYFNQSLYDLTIDFSDPDNLDVEFS